MDYGLILETGLREWGASPTEILNDWTEEMLYLLLGALTVRYNRTRERTDPEYEETVRVSDDEFIGMFPGLVGEGPPGD